MKFLLLSLLCFVAVLAEDDLDFSKWLDKYGYSAEAVDYDTWKANMEFVKEHRHKSASFTVSLNKFAHLKFTDMLKSNKGRGSMISDHKVAFKPTSAPPPSVDWRTKGVVTPVVDQGELYSSYPFSAADAVASFLAIKTGNLTVLSVEEVTDCCHYHPCSGRFTKNVFDCIHNIGGLCSNDSYKRDTNCACHNATCTPVGNIAGGKTVASGSESALTEAVAMEPIQVAIDAGQTSFQLYTSGIYDDPNCSPTVLDHSMLLVGYGTDGSGAEYWILKNSWGADWGEQGYMRMARNKGNMCGIASMADYPY